MKLQLLIIIFVLLSTTISAQNQAFSPNRNCSTDTSFRTGYSYNYDETLDMHIDQMGNYHTVGFGPNYGSAHRPMLFYKKYNKNKRLLYTRLKANPGSTGNEVGEYLNSVTTDQSLNYYYTGQSSNKGGFRFDDSYNGNIGASSFYYYDYAFIAKHDSINNLKFLILFAPIYNSNQARGFNAFTDIVYLNGKLYTLFNCAFSGSLQSYNFQNNSWVTLLSSINSGLYLLEIETTGVLSRIIPVSQSYNTLSSIYRDGGGSYGYYNSKAGSLAVDKQNRLLIHYLTQYNILNTGSSSISYGPNILASGTPQDLRFPFGKSALAVYDPQHGWLNGTIVESGHATNINSCMNTIESDIHGNKYTLTNNNAYTNSNQYSDISVVNNDTLPKLGAAISKFDVNGNFLWNKYFFDCNIMEMKLSPNQKHIGILINSNDGTSINGDSYTFGNKFSFGDSKVNVDTVTTKGYNTVFMQFSNGGVLEKMYQYGSKSTFGQFLNFDGNGYFNLNAQVENSDSAFYVINGDTIFNHPDNYSSKYDNTISFKIDGEGGQCTGSAFPGKLRDTLFIHLPHIGYLCNNSSLFIPWIATDTISFVNLGYYLKGSSTKNYIASNINAKDFGYFWNIPGSLSNADSLSFFIESTDLHYNNQTSFYKFYPNRNIITWKDTTVCYGVPLQIIPTDTLNLQWSPANYFSNPSLDSTQVISLFNNTQIFIQETSHLNTCISYDTVNVNVTQLPHANFNFTLLPTSFSVMNHSSNSDSIKWLINNMAPVYNQDSLNIVFNSATYNVCLVASNHCNKDTSCLTIDVHYSIIDTVYTCSGDSVFLEGEWQSVAGNYVDSLISSSGIDSVVTKALILHPTATHNKSISLCPGDSVYAGGLYQNIVGTYFDTLQTTNGCDSIIITSLNFYPIQTTNKIEVICEGDSVLLGGAFQSSSGSYNDHLQNSNGCDSTIVTQLIVNTVNTFTQSLTVCGGYTIIVGNHAYSTNGTYYDTLTSMVNSCDSMVTTHLTVDSMDVFVSVSTTTLTAHPSLATYQWINCSGNILIPGATNQSHTATANGNYAVIATMNGCSDTSACVNINTIGVDEIVNNNNHLTVYPNPSRGVLTIQSTTEGVYSIINELGQTIQQFTLNSANKFTTNIENLSNGIYFIVGFNNNQITKQKVVVAK